MSDAFQLLPSVATWLAPLPYTCVHAHTDAGGRVRAPDCGSRFCRARLYFHSRVRWGDEDDFDLKFDFVP
eukprot:6915689-Heterocapsa_arctica.AAC.1